jgi:hypothetical protein
MRVQENPAPKLQVARGMSHLLEATTRIAVELDHPACDCLYLALAVERDCRFVTADERFVRKLGERYKRRFRRRVIGLVQAAGELGRPTPREPRPR